MLDNVKEADGTVEVHIDPDKLKAYMLIRRPSGNGRKCSRDEAMKALSDKRVVFGINEGQVQEALQENNWERKILVAEGTPPIDGIDAQLEFAFQSQSSIQPKMDEAGKADFHNLGIVNNVRKGDLLVTKVPSRPGVPGADVHGNKVPPRVAKDKTLPRGKNTVADNDGIHLYAAVDGHMSFSGNKIDINPVFHVAGDVDYSSGNIEFIGSVIVKGNVTTGFKIQAGGDIDVQGSVQSADVIAQGSITVKGGINGKMKGRVAAGNNVIARFIENAVVEAGSNVLAKEAIIQSQIKAGNSVKVSDNKAIIVGGVIQAAEVVESKVLGSQLATQTVVEVGVNPYIREEYHNLVQKQTAKNKEFQNISHNLQVYNNSGIAVENLTEKKKQVLIKLLDVYTVLRNELQEIQGRLEFLEKEMKRFQTAEVRVMDVAYPGVRITIGEQVYVINDPMKYCRFVSDNGEIRTAALR